MSGRWICCCTMSQLSLSQMSPDIACVWGSIVSTLDTSVWPFSNVRLQTLLPYDIDFHSGWQKQDVVGHVWQVNLPYKAARLLECRLCPQIDPAPHHHQFKRQVEIESATTNPTQRHTPASAREATKIKSHEYVWKILFFMMHVWHWIQSFKLSETYFLWRPAV